MGRAQRGDHEAFETLVGGRYDRLHAVARRILRDPAAAEDAVQDAFINAWRDLRGLRDPDRFEAWLHRLVVNACRDHARRVRRRPIEVRVLPIDRGLERDAVAGIEDRDAIERAFLRLSVDHRAVLVLTYFLGCSAIEVAGILGVPAGTVYSRLHYGLAAMRDALGSPIPSTTTAPENAR